MKKLLRRKDKDKDTAKDKATATDRSPRPSLSVNTATATTTRKPFSSAIQVQHRDSLDVSRTTPTLTPMQTATDSATHYADTANKLKLAHAASSSSITTNTNTTSTPLNRSVTELGDISTGDDTQLAPSVFEQSTVISHEDFEQDPLQEAAIDTTSQIVPPSILPLANADTSSENLSFPSPTTASPIEHSSPQINRFKERKNSHISQMSTSTNISNSTAITSSNNGELKRMITSDIRKIGRNVMLKSSRHESPSFYPPTADSSFSSSSPSSSNISSLINPEWGRTIIKTSWINKLADHNEFRLFRLELKGSHLLIYKAHQDISYAKNLQIQDKSSQTMAQNSSEMASYMSSDVTKSNTDIANVNPEEGMKNEEKRPEDINLSSTSLPLSLSDAIDQMENLKLAENDSSSQLKLAPPTATTENNNDSSNNNNNNTNHNKHHKNPSSAKHLPFIIHDLYYQSPSCPHPKLVFDTSTGMIMRGTLEAICHTILFYPSERMAERLVEILPMISSLIDSLVYFQKYFDHFTDLEGLKMKEIKISDMEMNILFTRLKLIIESCLKNFKGCLLDDEIFNLLQKLLNSLIERGGGNYLNLEELNDLHVELFQTRNNLVSLIGFQLSNSNSEIKSKTVDSATLISGHDFIETSTESLAHEIQAIDLHVSKIWSPSSDKSMILTTLENIECSYNHWKLNPLQFIPSIHTHYLGRLLAHHLFVDDSTSKSAWLRSQVLQKWIKLGSCLYQNGDMVSFLGIATVVCSLPVLRLSETWCLVDSELLHEIRTNWAPIVFEVGKNKVCKNPDDKNEEFKEEEGEDGDDVHRETYNVEANFRIMLANNAGKSYAKEDAVPYFGELLTSDQSSLRTAVFQKNGCESLLGEESEHNILETDFIKTFCSYFEMVNWNLNQWNEYRENVVNAPGVDTKFAVTTEDMGSNHPGALIPGSLNVNISNALKTAIAYNSSNDLFCTSQLLSLSLATERSYAGKFAQYHNVSRSPLFLGSYASILFPKMLPHYEIYDQAELIGAIGGSKMLNIDIGRKYKNRNVFLKHIRDLLDVGSEEIKLADGSIVFKTSQPIKSSETSEADQIEEVKKPEIDSLSPPPKALFENPAKAKHLSGISTGSFNLDEYITSYQAYLKDGTNVEGSDVHLAVPESPIASSFVEKVGIVISAATTDRLIDLLVLTASAFGMHINKQDLASYSKKASINNPISLQMDDTGFTCTFFPTYRVFLTTKELIDALRKRFIGSKSAALSIMDFANQVSKKSRSGSTEVKFPFPKWDDEIIDDDSTWKTINWTFVGQIQLGVLEAILTLANGSFKHFMDDLNIKFSFNALLELIEGTIVKEWPTIIAWLKDYETDKTFYSVMDVFKLLQSTYKQVRNICIRKSYTPQISSKGLKFTDELHSIPAKFNLPESTDIDRVSNFVTHMNEMVESSMKSITTDDWIETFEILQTIISRSPLAMFNYEFQSSDTHTGLIKISNIYHWIMTLNDGEESGSADMVLDMLPVSIKSIFHLYDRFKTYILMQIIDDDITFDERIDRMCTLMKMIQVTRLRMQTVKIEENEYNEFSLIPSFVESVLVNTVTLPESRFFSHAWRSAASIYHGDQFGDSSLESLEMMLPKLSDYEASFVAKSSALMICPGWIIKRLIEIACFVPNMDVDHTELINFGKNRYIHNCILQIDNLQSKLMTSGAISDSTPFSFLLKFKGLIPSIKEVYDRSLQEQKAQKMSPSAIFDKHVAAQIELIKLEETKRDLLMKQHTKKESKLKNVTDVGDIDADVISLSTTMTKESSFTHGSISGNPLPTTSDHSIFDGASSTVVNSSIEANSTVTSQQLFSKVQGANVSNASISKMPSSNAANARSHVSSKSSNANSSSSPSTNKFKFGFFKSRPFSNNFHQNNSEKKSVNLEDIPAAESMSGKTRPVQTIVLKDVSIFSTYRTPNSFTIDTSSSNANSGNHEYTFQTITEEEASEWIYQLTYAKKHWFRSKILNKHFSNSCAKLTFGAPLSFVCERDNSPLPIIVEKMLSEIELRGIEEVGIYRKSASLLVVQQIKDEVNKTGDFNMENSLVFDIHNLTGCIKAYLRELPEPLISDYYVDQISKVRDQAQLESRFDIYKQILSKLPIYNYNLIERLSRHMKLIEEYKSQNKMTSYNLATIMGGSFVEGCRPETMRNSFGVMNFICEDWILHYDKVFQ